MKKWIALFGLAGMVIPMLFWGGVAWLVGYMVWPWLASILRANGVHGV
jgi:hypothetical protein